MRFLPTQLNNHLAEGCTTLAHCWKLTRKDGIVMGFTDHDRDLAFDGTTFSAQTGWQGAKEGLKGEEIGFAVTRHDVISALSASGITEQDILAGLYDGAMIELYCVNWADSSVRILLSTTRIGDIRREDNAFIAELTSLAARFDEEQGRLYTASCAADLGDTRCGINLEQPLFKGQGNVTETDGSLTIKAPGVQSFADHWFTNGNLVWLTGANTGSVVQVKTHGEGGLISLWQRAPNLIAAGDTFRIYAGCNKSFHACRAKFANAVNFRGFPHMPGNDFIIKIPQQGDPGLDGGSLFEGA
jgi:uncharacterized phage protein (TIGR02218 family)